MTGDKGEPGPDGDVGPKVYKLVFIELMLFKLSL